MSALDRHAGRLAAAALFVAYAVTAARGLMWFDAGELALVAAQGGVSHPPGQPLYTLLSAAAWRLGGLPALNLLSALCAAACALPADALLRRFTPLPGAGRLLALLAVGALAPVWDQASRIELYAPASLVFLVILAGGTRPEAPGPRAWLGLGLGVGLLACLNAVFAVGAALTVGGLAAPGLLRAPRRLAPALAAAIAGAALGLLPYLQIALSHGDPSRFIWGDFDTAAGWWAFLTGRDYGHTAHAAWGQVPAHASVWLGWLAGQGAAATALLGWLGWAARAETRRAAWLLMVPLSLGVAFTLTYGQFNPEVPDYNGYFMPAFWLAPVGLAALASRARGPLGPGLLALLVAVGAFTGERPAPFARSRAGLDGPDALARVWLAATPQDGVLLVESDHLVFPLMYRQEALGERPDVLLINVGFAASGWYWRHLAARHPKLPRIPLAAPSTAARLARLLAALPDRPVRVEHLGLAAGLGRGACLDSFGLRLDPCDPAADDPARFHTLSAALMSQGAHDLITPRVLAALALQRAEAAWALGDASTALAALSAGAPPGARAVPEGLRRPPGSPPLAPPPPGTLIGDPAHLQALGAALLLALHQPAAAATWGAP